MSETKVIPEDFHTWTKEQVAEAGFPTDEVAVVKGDNFASFAVSSPATITIKEGKAFTNIFIASRVVNGNGYVEPIIESGMSTGVISASSWQQFKTSRYITVTTINGSIYINFASASHVQVGSYAGGWGGSSFKSANGYIWWK